MNHYCASQIWQCGCGLEQPMTAPLFSKICTQRYLSPNSLACSAHRSTTASISAAVMSGTVTFDFGWKHITRHVPDAGSVRKSSSSSSAAAPMPF